MPINQPEKRYLINLLSSVIKGIQPLNPPQEMDWVKLYQFSAWHGVANMAWYGLNKLTCDSRPPQEIMAKFRKDCLKAVAKEATQHITVEKILKTFEESHIDSMPLKGYLVKYLYPQPDMRLMADVDILIKPDQAEQVKGLLLGLGFTAEHQGGSHDVYYRRPFMNLEMHRRLISEESPYSAYLKKTWDRAKLKAGCSYSWQLSPEDFFIYLLIHLTKHYTGGGTGIRSFLDIWVYLRNYEKELDWPYIRAELEQINLRKFAENITGLCEVWFNCRQSNELYEEMTEYIFSSGAYGTRKHSLVSAMNIRTARKQSLTTAKHLYRLKLFFPPLSTMKSRYPFLETLPLLLPAGWVLRGIKNLICKPKHTLQMINDVQSVSQEDIIHLSNLHQKAGL